MICLVYVYWYLTVFTKIYVYIYIDHKNHGNRGSLVPRCCSFLVQNGAEPLWELHGKG